VEGIGLGGIIFIWLAFFWPMILSTIYLSLRRSRITNAVRLWFVGTLVGYGLYMGGGPFLVFLLEVLFEEPEELGEGIVLSLIVLGFVIATALILLTLRKLEKSGQSSPNK
jgi:hypothetical protein